MRFEIGSCAGIEILRETSTDIGFNIVTCRLLDESYKSSEIIFLKIISAHFRRRFYRFQ